MNPKTEAVQASPAPASSDAGLTPKLYTCGTLSYTRPALALLFFWLFWGDICYTLMENMGGPIMQLKFEDLQSSNKAYMLFANTFPTLMFIFVNPVISFKSDRYRSRLGRRIPFIVFTLPFLTAGLVALAYCSQISVWVFHTLDALGMSAAISAIFLGVYLLLDLARRYYNRRIPFWTAAVPLVAAAGVGVFFRNPIATAIVRAVNSADFSFVTTAIVTIGILLVVFTFFNTIFTSMYWYLFRDVVPENVLGRFMSWFRFVSGVTFGLYQWFIFPHSRLHATEIFLSAAAIYLVGFGLMILFVREGKYEPPPPYIGGHKGPLSAVVTYGKECHSHAHYWYFWMLTFIGSIGGGVAAFNLYFQERIGLDLSQIGRIVAVSTWAAALMSIGVGWLADRYHPIRVIIAASLLGILVTAVNLIWLVWHPAADATWTWHAQWLAWIPTLHVENGHLVWGYLGPIIQVRQVYFVQFCIAIGLAAPVAALNSMWDPVLLMRVFPHGRFGQFASTNSLWRTGGGLLGGILAASALDLLAKHVGKDQAYFYMPFWQLAFSIPPFILLLMFYRSWKKYGGDDHYVAPVPGEEPSQQASAGTEPAAVAT